jgi:hypothetical protein
MTMNQRLLLAVAIILVDIVAFALPLTGFFAAYVLLARPPWFRDWVDELYRPDR